MPWSVPLKRISTASGATPASASRPASGVPVHSAVPTASFSQGWLIGRGKRRARPLPAHSSVTGRERRGRARMSSRDSVERAPHEAADLQPPFARVDLRNVEMDEQVVHARRRQVVAEPLERHALVARGELQLVRGEGTFRRCRADDHDQTLYRPEAAPASASARPKLPPSRLSRAGSIDNCSTGSLAASWYKFREQLIDARSRTAHPAWPRARHRLPDRRRAWLANPGGGRGRAHRWPPDLHADRPVGRHLGHALEGGRAGGAGRGLPRLRRVR